MQFGSTPGFFAFLSVAALIIIYLIRPRPKDVIIPSLMFIIKESGRALKSSFFEKLLTNLVFILQLIALAAAAFALTQPIINVAYDSASANTVIVLDASASMSANNNARFSKAVSIAKDSMKGDVSIILAEDYPVVLLDKESESKATEMLQIVRPKSVGSNIGDAMMLAKDLLEGKEGRVLVLSDFIYTTGPDPSVVKKILEAEGATVDLVNVGEKGSNVGIIDMLIGKYSSEAYIKNYNNEEKAVTVSVINAGKEVKKVSLSIQPNSVNTFSFETPAGMTEVKINENDDLKTDNTAFISAPEKTKIKVLMITNNVNIYLKKALESSKEVELTVANPPITPKFTDFDVVILGDFDKSKLLTGTLEDLRAWIDKGKGAVITARSDMNEINYKGLLPVTLKERVDKVSSKVYPYAESTENKYDFTETESLDFGLVNQYFNAEAENSSVVYAMTADSVPIIVSSKRGEGNIVYYGIMDNFGTFKASTYYPIFWNQLLNSLVGTEDIMSYNYGTGKILMLGSDMNVRTPSGSIRTSRLLLDDAGFYTFGEKTVSANLFNEMESDIGREVTLNTISSKGYSAKKVEKRKDVSLDGYFVFILLLAVLAEFMLLKYRGDV